MQCVIAKKSKFIKQQEASRLLSNLGIKIPLSKIPLVGPLLFNIVKQVNTRYKINELVNKFLLARDKYIPRMHLRQLEFTYSAYGPFTKKKERVQKLKETGDWRYVYQNKLDKGCFQHIGNFKDLTRSAASDKILHDKAFNIAKNSIYNGYERGFASMAYKNFD